MIQLALLALLLGPGGPNGEDIDYTTAHLQRKLIAVKTIEKITIDGKTKSGNPFDELKKIFSENPRKILGE